MFKSVIIQYVLLSIKNYLWNVALIYCIFIWAATTFSDGYLFHLKKENRFWKIEKVSPPWDVKITFWPNPVWTSLPNIMNLVQPWPQYRTGNHTSIRYDSLITNIVYIYSPVTECSVKTSATVKWVIVSGLYLYKWVSCKWSFSIAKFKIVANYCWKKTRVENKFLIYFP